MSNTNLHVKLIGDPEIESIGNILGISEERFAELKPLMAEAVESSNNPYEAISKMSVHAVHVNETVFMTIVTEKWFSKINNNPLMAIMSILQKGGVE